MDASNNPVLDTDAQGFLRNINFKGKSTSNFTLPVTVAHNVYQGGKVLAVADRDVGLHLFLESCGLIANSTKPDMRLTYQVQVSIMLISWTGYKPTFSGTIHFPCPANIPQNLFSDIETIAKIISSL